MICPKHGYEHDAHDKCPNVVESDAECGTCRHSPAYHDGAGGRPCRAWNPDEADSFCACAGWTEPEPPPPAPRTLVCDSEHIAVEPS